MKLIRVALRSFDGYIGTYRQFRQASGIRAISTGTTSGNSSGDGNNNSYESADDFERRILGFSSNNQTSDSFIQKLDKLEKARGRPGLGSSMDGSRSSMDGSSAGGMNSSFMDGLDDSFNTLSDGMDGKLKKAATYFEFDPEEIKNDNFYAFRPDVTYRPGHTYDTQELDIKKPGVRKAFQRIAFETTTEEVLRKADFRNVRFLANFITEAGIIIKRSQTRISAKAQRKVAREIKTARAFGLMPFTTMGEDPFTYGKTREDLDDEEDDYEYLVPDPIDPPDLDLP